MTNERLQCLAIRQPWAWAVCVGAKNVENRTWTTHHRGPLAIQASAAKQEVNALVKQSKGKLDPGLMTFGAVIGVVDLIEIEPLNMSLEGNHWATGPQCWRLANARWLEHPIPHKGSLHLFELPETVSTSIREQLGDDPKPIERSSHEWLKAIAPDPFETAVCRCQSYGTDLKDLGGAIRAADAAIRLQPELPLGYRLRGLGYSCNGDIEEAIQDFLHAVQIDPGNSNDHFQLALAYQAIEDQANSKSHWEKAKALDPALPELD